MIASIDEFAEAADKCRGDLERYANARLTRNAHQAKDLADDTIIKVVLHEMKKRQEGQEGFRGDAKLLSYLIRSMIYLFYDSKRSEASRIVPLSLQTGNTHPLDTGDDKPIDIPLPPTQYQRLLSRELHEHIDNLPSGQRSALEDGFEGLSIAEAAQKRGATEVAIRARKFQALGNLRKVYATAGPTI